MEMDETAAKRLRVLRGHIAPNQVRNLVQSRLLISQLVVSAPSSLPTTVPAVSRPVRPYLVARPKCRGLSREIGVWVWSVGVVRDCYG